jgi:hypothetical protein
MFLLEDSNDDFGRQFCGGAIKRDSCGRISTKSLLEGLVTLTKQLKIGLCEQVRVNWKTAADSRVAGYSSTIR